MHMAALIECPVFEAERHFGHLHGHREPADHEHPQDRARPAHGQCNRDPGDVPETDRSGERGGQGAPLTDVARGLVRAWLGPQYP